MDKKTIFVLTWCYEGCDDNCAHAQTLEVSFDKAKLIEKMREWVAKDCEVDDEDDWNEDKNFVIHRERGGQFDTEIILQHKHRTNLYTTYKIEEVNII